MSDIKFCGNCKINHTAECADSNCDYNYSGWVSMVEPKKIGLLFLSFSPFSVGDDLALIQNKINEIIAHINEKSE